MTFKHSIHTRYSETGQDGIIHHSSYIVYLEVARMEFFKSIGCEIVELEKRKIFCPVIDLNLQYIKPLYSLEDITVHVNVDKFTKVRFTLCYEIFRGETLINKATVSHCFMNGDFKPIAIPADIIHKLSAIALQNPR